MITRYKGTLCLRVVYITHNSESQHDHVDTCVRCVAHLRMTKLPAHKSKVRQDIRVRPVRTRRVTKRTSKKLSQRVSSDFFFWSLRIEKTKEDSMMMKTIASFSSCSFSRSSSPSYSLSLNPRTYALFTLIYDSPFIYHPMGTALLTHLITYSMFTHTYISILLLFPPTPPPPPLVPPVLWTVHPFFYSVWILLNAVPPSRVCIDPVVLLLLLYVLSTWPPTAAHFFVHSFLFFSFFFLFASLYS